MHLFAAPLFLRNLVATGNEEHWQIRPRTVGKSPKFETVYEWHPDIRDQAVDCGQPGGIQKSRRRREQKNTVTGRFQ
jgi:hypothetical protein